MYVLQRIAFASILMLGLTPVGAIAQQTGIIVNGQALTMQEAVAYQIQLPPGRYWYDPVSGFWGVEGRGYADQASPFMQIGGPLRPNASNGNTGVFVNGREIVHGELVELQAVCGWIPPGSYWLNHKLLAGPVGGPAACDASAGASARSNPEADTASNRPSDPSDPCYNPRWENKIACRGLGYRYPD